MNTSTSPKSSKKCYTEHYLYLVAVSEACGVANKLVTYIIVHYANLSMRVLMLKRLSLMLIYFLKQAEDLAHFSQSTEIELRK